MPNGNPLGIGDAVGRDVERVSRALGRSPLPPLAVLRGSQPDQVCQTAQAGVELLGRLTTQVAADLKVAAIDLWATSNVLKAEHQIRVEIPSSNFPRFDRNTNTGNTIAEDTES